MTSKEEVEAILTNGESVQLVGISGMGKSRLLHKFDGVYIDTAMLYPADYLSLLRNLSHSLGINTQSTNAVEIQDLISKKIGDKKLTIIIDHFEKIVTTEFTLFFRFLKALRDLHKQKLTFVFSVSGINPIGSSSNVALGDLFKIVQENIIFHQPHKQSGFESAVKSNFEQYVNKETNFKELYKLTGGIPSLIKAKLKNNDLLLDSQILEIKQQIENVPVEMLQKHGLVDDKGQLISELLRNNINAKSDSLTVLESSLFSVLKENINNVVSKDKICEAVYPEVKSRNGISDSSIDQLVHRLKKKLKDYRIENQHGLGYKLISN